MLFNCHLHVFSFTSFRVINVMWFIPASLPVEGSESWGNLSLCLQSWSPHCSYQKVTYLSYCWGNPIFKRLSTPKATCVCLMISYFWISAFDKKKHLKKIWCHTKRRMSAVTRAHPYFGMTMSQDIRDLFAWRSPFYGVSITGLEEVVQVRLVEGCCQCKAWVTVSCGSIQRTVWHL